MPWQGMPTWHMTARQTQPLLQPPRPQTPPPPHTQLEPTPIDTRGFQSLLSLVQNTTHDSFDLYYGLFMYNPVRWGWTCV